MAEETIRARAERLWEAVGISRCMCPNPEEPHWCERCQSHIDVIEAVISDALIEAEARATTAKQVTILDRLPDGRPRPSVSMYNHAVDVANANYRRAEADESQLRALQDQQETLRQRLTCRNGAPHYCPNCDNTFGPDLVTADPAPSAPPPPGEAAVTSLDCDVTAKRDAIIRALFADGASYQDLRDAFGLKDLWEVDEVIYPISPVNVFAIPPAAWDAIGVEVDRLRSAGLISNRKHEAPHSDAPPRPEGWQT